MKYQVTIVLILLAIISYSQDSDNIVLYASTVDFRKGETWDINGDITIKEEGNDFLVLEKITNSENGKRIKRSGVAWALKYHEEFFFNLSYSDDLSNPRTFVKLDVVGDYCLTVIYEDTSLEIKKSGINYGPGLTGVLSGESTKWSKHWKDKSGNKVLILFIDTNFVKPQSASRNEGSFGKYLTRKKLRDLIEQKEPGRNTDDLREMTVEEIIALVEKWNRN